MYVAGQQAQHQQQRHSASDAAASSVEPTPAAPLQDTSPNATGPLLAQQQQQQQQTQAEQALPSTSQTADGSLTRLQAGSPDESRPEPHARTSGQSQAGAGQSAETAAPAQTGSAAQPQQVASSAKQDAGAAELSTAPVPEEAEDATGKMLQSSGDIKFLANMQLANPGLSCCASGSHLQCMCQVSVCRRSGMGTHSKAVYNIAALERVLIKQFQ